MGGYGPSDTRPRSGRRAVRPEIARFPVGIQIEVVHDVLGASREEPDEFLVECDFDVRTERRHVHEVAFAARDVLLVALAEIDADRSLQYVSRGLSLGVVVRRRDRMRG